MIDVGLIDYTCKMSSLALMTDTCAAVFLSEVTFSLTIHAILHMY